MAFPSFGVPEFYYSRRINVAALTLLDQPTEFFQNCAFQLRIGDGIDSFVYPAFLTNAIQKTAIFLIPASFNLVGAIIVEYVRVNAQGHPMTLFQTPGTAFDTP